METLTNQFESRVAGCLEHIGLKPSMLGGRAMGDPNLVRRLRLGCSAQAGDGLPSPGVHRSLQPGPCGPVSSRGNAPRGSFPDRTERQTDDESNGTGHGRARPRPAVTSSANPHGAVAEHDLICERPTGASPSRSGWVREASAGSNRRSMRGSEIRSPRAAAVPSDLRR